MSVQPISDTTIPIQARLSAVAEILALALLRRQQRSHIHSTRTVDDALTLSRMRAFIGTTNQRGGRMNRHDPTTDIPPITTANHRDQDLADGRAQGPMGSTHRHQASRL